PAGAQPVQEQGDGAQNAEGPALRARSGRARSQEGGSRKTEDRHRVGKPDSLLRISALHDGERPPHRSQGGRRAEGDGRRPGSFHRGVPQAFWEQSSVTSFVEVARKEKLQELVRRGVVPFAYAFARSHSARDALTGFQENDAATYRLAGRLVALRPHGKTTFGHLADRSGRIQIYCKQDQLGPAAYELLSLLDL